MSDNATPENMDLTAEQVLEAEVKELLKRYGLSSALVEKKTSQVYFDPELMKRLLAKDAKAYTEIKAS